MEEVTNQNRQRGTFEGRFLEAVTHGYLNHMTIPTCQLGSFGGSVVKNSPAVQETWVPSVGGEDPLKEKMATHSSYSCLVPRTEEPVSPRGRKSQTQLSD